jgi:hypothetical protein
MDDVEKQTGCSPSRGPSIEAGAYDHLNRNSALQSPDALLLPTTTGPHEGWSGWLTILGAFFALFCSFGQLNAFGTYQSWYSDHQLSGHSPSSISWIGSLQLWTFFVMVNYLDCQLGSRSMSERV